MKNNLNSKWKKRYVKPKAKVVRILWMDACHDDAAYITHVNPDHQGGVLDEVVGYLVGETKDFYITADSANGDSTFQDPRRYRCTRDIPKVLVLSIKELR